MVLNVSRRIGLRAVGALATAGLSLIGGALLAASPASAAGGVDLRPVFTDVTFGAGSVVDIKPMSLKNAGPVKATGVILTLDLVSETSPAPLRFTAQRNDCTVVSESRLTCPMPDVPAGATVDAPYGEVFGSVIETKPVPGSSSPKPMPIRLKVSISSAEPELAPADNTVTSPQILRTVASPANDWVIKVDPVDGKVGDVVYVRVWTGFRGPGNAQQGETIFTYVAPPGTEFFGDFGGACVEVRPKKERRCTTTGYQEPAPTGMNSFEVPIKILDLTVGDGEMRVEGMGGDLQPADNSAKIIINVAGAPPRPSASVSPGPAASSSGPVATPGLPVTGDRPAVLVAAGGAVVVVGLVLFVLGRRRRVRLEVPRD